jgi:hypothetical protein
VIQAIGKHLLVLAACAAAPTFAAAPAQTAGLSVVYNVLYPVGTLDHSAAIGGIKAQQPDFEPQKGNS